jgi:hypothetical protein
MQLFIGRIPHEIGRKELYRFVARGIRNKMPLGLLQKNRVTFDCKIMVMRDKDTGGTEHFVLVSHLPYKIAQRIIKNLNGAQINGTVVEVREHRVRSWENDRRQLYFGDKLEQQQERRGRDRRDRWMVKEIREPRRVMDGGRAQLVKQPRH